MRTSCFALASVTLFSAGAFGQPKDIPVASDVTVEAPAAGIPKELAAFSGKWFGHYNGVNTGAYMSDGLIVVEKIVSPTDIQVFYSGIGRHSWNYGQPWSYRTKASFSNGELDFRAATRASSKHK